MQNAPAVGKLERVTNRRDDRQSLLWCESPDAHRLPQVYPIDEFHDEESKTAAFAKVMHGDDVRMAEARQHPAFAGKTLREPRCGSQRLGQDLQRDDPIQLWLSGAIDNAHASVPDQIKDLQIWKSLRDLLLRGPVVRGQWLRVCFRRQRSNIHQGLRIQSMQRIIGWCGRWNIHDTSYLGKMERKVTRKIGKV